MGQPGYRILVVDDDPVMGALISDALTPEGYGVRSCRSAEQALSTLQAERFDLILTDIRLPRLSGLDLLGMAESAAPDTPVIVMTAYASLQTAIQALRGRAADYLTKPFTTRALRQRVATAIRSRATHAPQPRVLQVYDLRIDRAARRVWIHDCEVSLTRREFGVLALVVEREGGTVSYEELLAEVWEQDARQPLGLDAVKSCVYRLRKKLGDNPRAPRYVVNVHGVGYRLGE